MKLIDNSSKTNWKFIVIALILGLLVGGGIAWYSGYQYVLRHILQYTLLLLILTIVGAGLWKAWQRKQWWYLSGMVISLASIFAVLRFFFDLSKEIAKSCEGLGCLGIAFGFIYLGLPILGAATSSLLIIAISLFVNKIFLKRLLFMFLGIVLLITVLYYLYILDRLDLTLF